MKPTIIQWHPGFQAILQIELEEELDVLQFQKEYNLTEKPLQIDTLIIKLKPGHRIRKSIGHLFRQYNILEYKGPDDYVSINDFFKVIGYASVLQSNTERKREIPPEEITMTFAASHYPDKLIRFLKDTYKAVTEVKGQGVTYVSGLLFPVQILQLPMLDPDEYQWLSRLRRNLLTADLDRLTRAYQKKQQNPLYQAAINLIMRANPREFREGKEMLEALEELFPEEFAEKNRLLEELQKKMEEQEEILADQKKKLEGLKKQADKLEKYKKQNKKLKKKLNLRKSRQNYAKY
ncbi:MAG: 3-isopropylmalate dehydrogenase [Lachnospiraceae bacterium]